MMMTLPRSHMRRVYEADATGDALPRGISSFDVQLNVDRSLPANALNIDVAGDWLYVDPISVGYALVDLGITPNGGSEVALSAGRVFQTPFRRISVRHGRYPLPVQVAGSATQQSIPRMRVFYGNGVCPFSAVADIRAAYAADVSLAAGNPVGVSCTFDMPAGAIMDISVRCSQVITGAATSYLLPMLSLEVGGVVLSGEVTIDSLWQPFFSGAGLTARMGARWKDVLVPVRDAAFATGQLTGVGNISVLNLGTEASNSVFFEEVCVVIR